jgi:phosphopentomutase
MAGAMAGRVFLIVLDSFGIGALPDAGSYGDAGSNTLRAVSRSGKLAIPQLRRLGLYNIDGAEGGVPEPSPSGAYCRLAERSAGKDTTTGHWELSGLILDKAFPTFPEGFPDEALARLSSATGRGILCNKPYSGTQVIMDYGRRHMETGDLIVYTSADSVMQIAAHEQIIPLRELYQICGQARGIMQGEYAVGRIIARPFEGSWPGFSRTAGRHDISLNPTGRTMLDELKGSGLDTIGVGKIHDIFAGRGLTRTIGTKNNREGMDAVLSLVKEDFHGLCFVNLVDFDMLYGHRNDVDGYAAALTEFDLALGGLLPLLRGDDLLLITADHGCDPSTPSTDHSREYVPLLAYGAQLRAGQNLGTRSSFADVAATVQEILGLPVKTAGSSMLSGLILIPI